MFFGYPELVVPPPSQFSWCIPDYSALANELEAESQTGFRFPIHHKTVIFLLEINYAFNIGLYHA